MYCFNVPKKWEFNKIKNTKLLEKSEEQIAQQRQKSQYIQP
jgi:hypothetical protein